MRQEYADDDGKTVAFVKDGCLYHADGSMIGRVDDISQEVLCEQTGAKIVLCFGGMFLGPNQVPIAQLREAESHS